MANTYSESEVQMIELIGTYLKYRGLDAVIGINKGKEAYRLLENFGSDNVFAVAKKMLTDDDDNLRCRAAEMLMRIDSNKGLPLILTLLTDSVSGVRAFVCGIIHDFGDARAIDDVVKVLTQDSDGTVRHHAAFALGSIGTVDTIPILKKIAESETATDWEGHPVKEQIYRSIEAVSKRA